MAPDAMRTCVWFRRKTDTWLAAANPSSGRRVLVYPCPVQEDGDLARRLSSDEFDNTFPVGAEPGNSAHFGKNVLQGLVDGIDDFVHTRQQRWHRPGDLFRAMLGSAMWIDDPDLINMLEELGGACIVITKQGKKLRDLEKLKPLVELNERGPGLPVEAIAALTEPAPRGDGKPAVVGPYTPRYEGKVPTVHTLGFRRLGDLPPIIHAKMALLGYLAWHEDGSPFGSELLAFEPVRLWVSSANFTASSRRNLEFGYWTEDTALLQGAERFLVKLMGSSEVLEPDSDAFDPGLVPAQTDEAAMWQSHEQTRWGDPDLDVEYDR